jgi:hypothetical protein
MSNDQLQFPLNAPTEAVRLPTDFGISDLMPVELINGMLFKRDDLFKPFADLPVSGGKLRQCLTLVLNNLDKIHDEYDSTIATAASVHSPQSVIVARIACQFNLRCIIGHGAKKPLQHEAMRYCRDYGAELVQLATANAYNSLLYARLSELREERSFFTINFGYDMRAQPESIIEPVALQVRNIPADIDALIINVGSGVSANAILNGIGRYWRGDPTKLRIHLIQPFDYDRAVVTHLPRVYYWRGGYSYAQRLKLNIGPIDLDEIYEAKAYDFMCRMKNYFEAARPCFWLIGNSNGLRR